MIDPHVHLRDEGQRHKETLQHGLSVAKRVGISAVFDMPNTDPPILRRKDVLRRLNLAKKADCGIFYGLYCGLSANPEQIREAVNCTRDFPQVVGLKLFAGRSTGDLAVISEAAQKIVFAALARAAYTGVLAAHAESESYFSPASWDPAHPITHTLARPPIAELHAISQLLQMAEESGFSGTLHICHITLPDSVHMLEKAREKVNFRISCGATPHHLLLNDLMMEEPEGLLFKMNPPLRDHQEQTGLLSLLLEGRIDWLETDHAPHLRKEKLEEPYASGIPGFPVLPHLINVLRRNGADDPFIRRITHDNIESVFGIHIPYCEIRQA
ncbi:MAG: dihydroorotase, partial [Candidatus Marinimicrobia bacterium]|nr:dihydroorotase [Candidatus Neomarinimicrobiota bacterium]